MLRSPKLATPLEESGCVSVPPSVPALAPTVTGRPALSAGKKAPVPSWTFTWMAGESVIPEGALAGTAENVTFGARTEKLLLVAPVAPEEAAASVKVPGALTASWWKVATPFAAFTVTGPERLAAGPEASETVTGPFA